MDPYIHQCIQSLTRQTVKLQDELVDLRQQRDQVQWGSNEYKCLSGQLDRVLTDLEDAQADLRQVHYVCGNRDSKPMAEHNEVH